MKKRIVILGSTGSIGGSTLKVVAAFPDRFEVVGLTGKREIDILERQIGEHHPELVALLEGAEELRRRVKGRKVKVLSGEEGLVEVAKYKEADLVVSAIVGTPSLIPTLEAIRSGKSVALASKEAMVMAGRLLREEAERAKVALLPVDSEPNAIFQCLQGAGRKEVKKLILTASGGPFYNWDKEALSSITPEEALNHPTWKMGRKITIDSATLMNKGLEVIEASHFFDIDISRIEVVIHPQSKVHSLVEFVDGSMMALLGITDMRIPIQWALTYPERVPNQLPALDLVKSSPLTFQTPDMDKFPCLQYAYQAGRIGKTMPTVLNAANEVAVEAFLGEEIKFPHIGEVSRKVMGEHHPPNDFNLESIIEADRWARQQAELAVEEVKK
ncbi:1-deoxy-D-xylulose-5-phosphate reductoisomerase [candidate division NPL-UPA2 bacterium]|nr:1-deoxy-D-xylulose-5-phosphate reductoisomerase [candidate division NPL-UPA2 bacterium]